MLFNKNYVGLATTESKMMVFLDSDNLLEVWSQVCGPVICLHQITTIRTANNLGSITNSRFLSNSGNVSSSAHRGSTKQTLKHQSGENLVWPVTRKKE